MSNIKVNVEKRNGQYYVHPQSIKKTGMLGEAGCLLPVSKDKKTAKAFATALQAEYDRGNNVNLVQFKDQFFAKNTNPQLGQKLDTAA
jgi:hypothetical protein